MQTISLQFAIKMSFTLNANLIEVKPALCSSCKLAERVDARGSAFQRELAD